MTQVSSSAAVFSQFQPPGARVLPGGTPILVAVFSGGPSFLDAFSPKRGAGGELTVKTRYNAHEGSPVVVEIGWPGLPNRVLIRATVGKRQSGHTVVLRLDPGEAPKRDFLRQVARGEIAKLYHRNYSRFCVRLPLQWRRFGATVLTPGVAEDVSSGGCLIVTREASLVPGDRVAVRLHPEQALLDLVLTGTVQHVRKRPALAVARDVEAPAAKMAFGMKFEYRSSAEQRTLRALLRAFAASGVVLVAPTA